MAPAVQGRNHITYHTASPGMSYAFREKSGETVSAEACEGDMNLRVAQLAAAMVALGWLVALSGEVFGNGTVRMKNWQEFRARRANSDDATTLDRLRGASWPGYVISAVIGAYTGIVILGLIVPGRRSARLRVAGALLGTLGLAVAGWRLGGDFAWQLWELVPGDLIAVCGYTLTLFVARRPPHGYRQLS